jgi:site-specific recombinase XerD
MQTGAFEPIAPSEEEYITMVDKYLKILKKCDCPQKSLFRNRAVLMSFYFWWLRANWENSQQPKKEAT